MEFIIWGAAASVLGLGLGYLGYFHSKLAYTIFTTGMSIILFFSSYLVSLTGGKMAGPADMQMDNGHILGGAILRNVMRSIDAMGYLPMHVQVAILVFVVSFFASRIATWAGVSFGAAPAEETAAERKQRVLASYGMKSMDDVRSMR